MFVLFFDKAKVDVPTLGDFVQSFNFTLFRISHYGHHVETHPDSNAPVHQWIFYIGCLMPGIETIKGGTLLRVLKYIACSVSVMLLTEIFKI